MKQLHLQVIGHVQGVGYRYFAQMKAVQHEIAGWVRNHPDGSVEILAQGTEHQLNRFVQDIRKGNPFSRVEHVEVSDKEPVERFKSFKIKY